MYIYIYIYIYISKVVKCSKTWKQISTFKQLLANSAPRHQDEQ